MANGLQEIWCIISCIPRTRIDVTNFQLEKSPQHKHRLNFHCDDLNASAVIVYSAAGFVRSAKKFLTASRGPLLTMSAVST